VSPGASTKGMENLASTMMIFPDTYERNVLLILEEKIPFLIFNPTSVKICMYKISLQKASIITCKPLTEEFPYYHVIILK